MQPWTDLINRNASRSREATALDKPCLESCFPSWVSPEKSISGRVEVILRRVTRGLGSRASGKGLSELECSLRKIQQAPAFWRLSKGHSVVVLQWNELPHKGSVSFVEDMKAKARCSPTWNGCHWRGASSGGGEVGQALGLLPLVRFCANASWSVSLSSVHWFRIPAPIRSPFVCLKCKLPVPVWPSSHTGSWVAVWVPRSAFLLSSQGDSHTAWEPRSILLRGLPTP